MNRYRFVFIFFFLIVFILILPHREKILYNNLLIDIQYKSIEKEVYIIQGEFPITFDIKTTPNLLKVTLEKIITMKISDDIKDQKLSLVDSLLDNSKKANINFSIKDFPYYDTRYYPSHKTLIIELNKHTKRRLYQKTIIIDPGHGAYSDDKDLWEYYDCGVIGSSGIYESEINLLVAQKVKDLLVDYGAEVILTREKEKDRNALRFEQRGILVNDIMPDAYIAIHHNSSIDKTIRGTVLYYSNLEARKLAIEISREVKNKTNLPIYNLIDGKFEMIELMKIQAKVLIECAFLSNLHDEKIVLEKDYPSKIADGIVMGIINFFENQEK